MTLRGSHLRALTNLQADLKKGNVLHARTTEEQWPCLVAKFKILNLSHQRESYMHGVLNLDKIKNKLHSFLVNCETNIKSLIRL